MLQQQQAIFFLKEHIISCKILIERISALFSNFSRCVKLTSVSLSPFKFPKKSYSQWKFLVKSYFTPCLKNRKCDIQVSCRAASTRCSQSHWKERGSSPAILTYISSLLHSIQAVGTVCNTDCCFPHVKRCPFPPEVLDKMSIPNTPQNN